MEKRKRIALCKKDGLTMRMEYGFVTDEEFQESLNELSQKTGINVNDIITYSLGDEDETEEGNAYFCPRCGAYNEFGYEPETHLLCKPNAETNVLESAGYYKMLTIDCDNCDEVFEIHTEQFQKESEKLSEALKSGE